MMNLCSLTFEEIVDFYEGRHDTALEARVQQHLNRRCTRCQERLAWLQQYLPALHTAVTEEAVSAPEAALARARNIARERMVRPVRTPLRERIAQLLFDSHQPLTAATVRGAEEPGTQQLYATEDHYVEVWIERMQEGGYYLIGQAVSKSDRVPVRPQSVVLVAQDGSRTDARQEGSEFHLASVAGGRYQVRIHLEDQEIVLPELLAGG